MQSPPGHRLAVGLTRHFLAGLKRDIVAGQRAGEIALSRLLDTATSRAKGKVSSSSFNAIMRQCMVATPRHVLIEGTLKPADLVGNGLLMRVFPAIKHVEWLGCEDLVESIVVTSEEFQLERRRLVHAIRPLRVIADRHALVRMIEHGAGHHDAETICENMRDATLIGHLYLWCRAYRHAASGGREPRNGDVRIDNPENDLITDVAIPVVRDGEIIGAYVGGVGLARIPMNPSAMLERLTQVVGRPGTVLQSEVCDDGTPWQEQVALRTFIPIQTMPDLRRDILRIMYDWVAGVRARGCAFPQTVGEIAALGREFLPLYDTVQRFFTSWYDNPNRIGSPSLVRDAPGNHLEPGPEAEFDAPAMG